MKNYDELVKINHTLNWSYFPNHLYRILIIGGSGSGKTNVLLNLIELNKLQSKKQNEKGAHDLALVEKLYVYKYLQ